MAGRAAGEAEVQLNEESSLVELAAVMARLRAECAWKAGQTHESLVRYLLEETYEVVEAIESGSTQHLREELGDLLLQVFFHAAIAARSIRHEPIFLPAEASDPVTGLAETLCCSRVEGHRDASRSGR